MFIKRALVILLAVSLFLLPACGKEQAETTAPGQDIDDLMGDYGSLLNAYSAKPLDVTVTLTVEGQTPLENRFSLKQDEAGYTLTDLAGGKSATYGPDVSLEQLYKVAGYLPPYETAYPNGDGSYSSRVAGDINLEKLLSGSNLFDGYTADEVSLEGDCVYTAFSDGALSAYSYEFSVNINDAEAQFQAKIKYNIEVNK